MVGSLILYASVWLVLPSSTWNAAIAVFSVRMRRNPFMAERGKFLSWPPLKTEEKVQVKGMFVPLLFERNPLYASSVKLYCVPPPVTCYLHLRTMNPYLSGSLWLPPVMQRGRIFAIPAPGIFRSKFPSPPRPRGESPRSGNPREKQEKSSIVLLCMSIYFYVHSIHPFHTPTQQGMLIVIILHFKMCLIGGGFKFWLLSISSVLHQSNPWQE